MRIVFDLTLPEGRYYFEAPETARDTACHYLAQMVPTQDVVTFKRPKTLDYMYASPGTGKTWLATHYDLFIDGDRQDHKEFAGLPYIFLSNRPYIDGVTMHFFLVASNDLILERLLKKTDEEKLNYISRVRLANFGYSIADYMYHNAIKSFKDLHLIYLSRGFNTEGGNDDGDGDTVRFNNVRLFNFSVISNMKLLLIKQVNSNFQESKQKPFNTLTSTINVTEFPSFKALKNFDDEFFGGVINAH